MTDSTHVAGVPHDVDETAGRPGSMGGARGALAVTASGGGSGGGGALTVAASAGGSGGGGPIGGPIGGKARAVLRARFGEEVYGSWFHLMEFESFDGRTLRTSLPTKFLQTWIQAHY